MLSGRVLVQLAFGLFISARHCLLPDFDLCSSPLRCPRTSLVFELALARNARMDPRIRAPRSLSSFDVKSSILLCTKWNLMLAPALRRGLEEEELLSSLLRQAKNSVPDL